MKNYHKQPYRLIVGHKKIKDIVPIVMAVSGNLTLAFIFFQALIFPQDWVDFIFRASVLIFIVEFVSIHSSGMAARISASSVRVAGMNVKISKNTEKIFFIVLYLFIVVAISMAYRNWIVPMFFFISLLTKFFGNKSRSMLLSSMIYNVILFSLSILFVLYFSEAIKIIFPIPLDVLLKKDPGSGGLFIDTPQIVLFWGVMYFVSLAIMEYALFKKSLKIFTAPKK